MRNIHSRLLKLKKENATTRKIPTTFGLVYLGDDNWRENEKMTKEKYLGENGTLEGLIILRHWIPEPLPVPTEFRNETEGA